MIISWMNRIGSLKIASSTVIPSVNYTWAKDPASSSAVYCELSDKKKPMMDGAEYLETIPVTGMSIQNILTTISTAFEDGKRSMDAEWHSVMKQYCEEHDLNYLVFIKEIAPMFSDAQEETEESDN